MASMNRPPAPPRADRPALRHVRIVRTGAVATLVIDRPARFNSLDVLTAQELRRAGLELARDAEIRCVVLTGTEGVFCSGADLKYVRQRGDAADFEYLHPQGTPSADGYGASFKEILEYIHSTISEIKRAPKTFIAAVDGVAAAGGFGLAMCCDLVYASERATFEWAYHKTGLTGAESSTFFLPRLVGLRQAMELVLLNPRLSAADALRRGLVTGVLPTAGFMDAVLAIAAQVAAGPTLAQAVAKTLLNQAAGMDQLDYHLDRELQELARIADGASFAEGLAAFFEKRPANFEGTE